MAWYRTGTVAVTNGSTTVTGSGTSWITGVGVGEAFYGPDGRVYEIANIISATSLTLGSAYLGSNQSGQAYQIVPTQSYIRDLAADAAALVAQYGTIASTTGAGKFEDGTVALPGISFSSDNDTGIRRAGINDLRLVSSGVDRVTVNTSGAAVTGTLSVSSNTTLTGNLQVDGNTTLGNASVDTLTVAPSAVTWSNNPTHSGNHTYSGNVTVNGSTTIGDNSADALTVAPSAVTWSNNPTHSGNHTYSGNVSVQGNATLGNSTSLDSHTINGPTVVAVNSATAALRINQVGSGNAFVVEDSTAPDATPFVIDPDGRVIKGHTTALVVRTQSQDATPDVQIHGAGVSASVLSVSRWGNAVAARPNIVLTKYRGATIGDRTVVLSGDELGAINFNGASSTSTDGQAASISANAEGTIGDGSVPGRLVFSTTLDGASTPTERYRINNAGNHFFGNTTTNTNSTLMVVNGEISETTNAVQYKLVNQSDIGTAPNEIPLNQYLGSMAYEDHDNVAITGGVATLSNATLANANIAAGTVTLSNATLANADITSLRQTTKISNINPTLNLNFAKSKALDPRVTFARDSEGRFYDGRTFAKAEENLLLQSEDFTTTWTVAGVNATVTANTAAAPNGTTTADTLTDDATSGIHRCSQTLTTSSTAQLVFSCFVKYSTMQWIALSVSTATGNWAGAKFDVQNGVAGSISQQGSGWTANSSSITAVGNGWYRCVLVLTPGASGTTGVHVNGATDGTTFTTGNRGSEVYSGTGSSVFIWGAQLEQRSSVTAYTPTTTEPITNYIPVLQTAAANVARFDHDPLTGESLGLLIEEQRTNLLLRSAEFNEASWGKTRSSVTANTVIAPDGTLSADKLIEDTSNDTHIVQQSSLTLTSAAHTWSVYLKAGERTWARVTLLDSATTFGAYFNLLTGAVGVTAAGTTAIATPVGNGWFRCSITATTAATSAGFARVLTASGANTQTYTGDGYSGIYIWGAQLEAGAFPTSYIPTVASQVTRQADAASMTGVNFSSWFRADEGTVYFESQTAQGTNAYPWSLFGSSTQNRISTNYSTNLAVNSSSRINNVFDASVASPSSSAPLNTFGKGATGYKVNDFGFSWNGAAALTDTATTPPVVQQFDIGNNGGLATNWLNGHIRRITYYPARLSNDELQEMTA